MKSLHPLLRWTLYGWLLSAMMASVVFLCHRFLPWHEAALGLSLAFVARIFLGKWREAKSFNKMAAVLAGKGAATPMLRWLAVGLYLVFLLLCVASLVVLPPLLATATLFAVVPFSRMAASQLAQMLPYRGKSSLPPSPYSVPEGLLLFGLGILPMGFLWWYAGFLGYGLDWNWTLFAPCVVLYGLYLLLATRLRGFTYDSLVFVASMVELALLLTVMLSLRVS